LSAAEGEPPYQILFNVMQHVIIGTAGHVDHGKTTLIGALTGIQTDRLKEEQERGVSIELGFAYFDLPDGSRAGIIDVPGHERFIKHMLIGAYAMDVVLLVIDATEGVMPQTQEHLDIIDLLGARTGIIVITKVDLVEDEEIELCEEEARELLRGHSLEGAPVARVSAVTGEGLEELKHRIVEQVAAAQRFQRPAGLPRLYVDRVFPMTGFGAVVTGTLLGGSLRREDRVRLLPGDRTARVRGIQNHGADVEEAFSGQRIALNLAGVKLEELKRGDVVVPSEVTRVTDRLDAVVRLRESNPDFFTHWTRVRFYTGTHEAFGRAVLLGVDEVLPGDQCYVQFRLEEPILAWRGDRFIIRDFSAQRTLGGGSILDPFPPRHKRLAEATLARLERWGSGVQLPSNEAGEDKTLRVLVDLQESLAFPEETVLYYLPRPPAERAELLARAAADGLITRWQIGEERWIVSAAKAQQAEAEILALLDAFHQAQPLAAGQNAATVRRSLTVQMTDADFDRLVDRLVAAGEVAKEGNLLRRATHELKFSEREADLREQMETLYRRTAFNSPGRDELSTKLNGFDEGEIERVFRALLRLGALVDVGEGILLHTDVVQRGIERIRQFINSQGPLKVSDFRTLLDTSRKYAVPFLEYCDRQGLTRRQGDVRVLRQS
jgi:selenocysteine-specific elongation factor